MGKKTQDSPPPREKTWKPINFLRVPDFQTKLLPVPFCLDTYCFWMFLVRFWWKILRVFMMLVKEKSPLAWAKFIFLLARYPHTHEVNISTHFKWKSRNPSPRYQAQVDEFREKSHCAAGMPRIRFRQVLRRIELPD